MSPATNGDGDGPGDGDGVTVPGPGDGDMDGDGDFGDGDVTTVDGGVSSCGAGMCFWSTTDPSGCQSAGVPTIEMAPTDTADGDIGALYLGWSKLWIGESNPQGAMDENAWEAFGFDLDGTCSNSGTCDTADADLSSCKPGGVQLPYDGQTCRDNTFGRNQPVVARVPELGEVFGLTEDAFNCSLRNGAYTQIMRITGYNGEKDDDSVRVDFYASSGLVERMSWSCPMEDFETKYPLWLASSHWYIDDADLTGPIETEGTLPDSKRFSTEAYVRDGYLVALTGDDFLIHLPGDNSAFPGWAMRTQKGVFTGRLERLRDGTWVLNDGLMGGRLKGVDLLQAFQEIGVCPEGALAANYRTIEQYVRDGSDLLADGTKNAELECDAMSIGVAFQARPVTPGPAANTRAVVDCCLAENMDTPSCPVGCGDGRVVGGERCDIGIDDGKPGACPTQCVGRDACHPKIIADTGCNAYCMEVEITALQDDDGCCPTGGNATNDNDCVNVCGNGVVEQPAETCDPPGNCPTANNCKSSDVCKKAQIMGDANSCDAACVLTDITSCIDDDGCCAPGCKYTNDNDCPEPTLCGNGMIDQGETCDPPGSCPTTCNDNKACTADSSAGLASECTLRCVNQDISSCIDDDGCCPTSCNSTNDNDCGEMCGNGILEGMEECDDGNTERLDNCYDCKTETHEEQCNWIISNRGDTSAACQACQCSKCADEFVTCTNGPNDDENALCGAVIQCGVTSGCRGEACYCGSRTALSCLWFGPAGPCVSEIRAAAGTSDTVEVLNRGDDPRFPVGRAKVVSTCTEMNCSSECAGN